MAKIRATDFNVQTGDVASVDVVLPRHEAGDVILVFTAKDDVTGAASATTTPGWFRGGSGVSAGATTAGTWFAWFVKVATSNTDDPVTITNSDSDSWSIVAVSIKDAGVSRTITAASWAANVATFTSNGHGFVAGNIVNITGVTPTGYNIIGSVTGVTTNTFTIALTVNPGAYTSGGSANCIIDAVGTVTTDSTGAPYTVPGVTTNYANSLVFFASASGATGAPIPYPTAKYVSAVDSGNEGIGVGCFVKATAGATGSVDFYTDGLNQNTIGCSVAVRDSGTGDLEAYFDTDWALMLHPLRGINTIMPADVWNTTPATTFPTLSAYDADAVFQFDASPTGYVDYTAAAASGTDNDVICFPATEAIDDAFLIGHAKPYTAVLFDRAGATQGTGGVATWEYLATGGVWRALLNVNDATTFMTSAVADAQLLRFQMPPRYDWAKTSVNGSADMFWIRLRVTTVYTINPTVSQVRIGGASVLYGPPSSVQNAGVVQYSNVVRVTPVTSVTQIGGTYLTMGTAVNLSGKIISGTYQYALPQDYLETGSFREGGGNFVMVGESTNRRVWCVGSYLDKENSDAQRNRFAIDIAQTVDTSHYSSETAVTYTSVNLLGLWNWSIRGRASVQFSQMIAIDPANTVVNGGRSTNPINLDAFRELGNYGLTLLFRDDIIMVPVTFGGSDACHVAIDNFTFTFPTVATPPDQLYAVNVYSQAHYDLDKLGFIIDTRAGDTMKLTNGKITSVSRWRFEIKATASASATYDFTGLLLINSLVTLRAVCTFAGMTFNTCAVTQNSAVIDNCSFVNTLVTSDNPGLIDNCDFTKTTGTQHAIEITTAGTYSMAGNSFTGYAGTNGSTGNEAIYNNSGGAVTLNITGGGTPSIRNGAGASTTVNNNVSITLTGLKNPTEVRVFLQGTTTEVSGTGAENVTTGSHTFSVGGGVAVDIVILSLGYQNTRILNYSTVADATIPVSQVLDRQYNNP